MKGVSLPGNSPLESLGLGVRDVQRYRSQLLKWVGNKQRFAHLIAAYFPLDMSTYFEPFLGSGAVLATLQPERAVAGDAFGPLMGIWSTLQDDPEMLKWWYAERWKRFTSGDPDVVYAEVLDAYNSDPNPADFLFLTRTCYGGVVRFRRVDGAMSTPRGVHKPITPESFAKRVTEWRQRTSGTTFIHADFEETMARAGKGDLIYCDPPYVFSQAILYGAQSFTLERLWSAVAAAKSRGAYVVVSIDGTKKTGAVSCHVPVPDGLFEEEVLIAGGRSMLRRFQRAGEQLADDEVADRLLLTF